MIWDCLKNYYYDHATHYRIALFDIMVIFELLQAAYLSICTYSIFSHFNIPRILLSSGNTMQMAYSRLSYLKVLAHLHDHVFSCKIMNTYSRLSNPSAPDRCTPRRSSATIAHAHLQTAPRTYRTYSNLSLHAPPRVFRLPATSFPRAVVATSDGVMPSELGGNRVELLTPDPKVCLREVWQSVSSAGRRCHTIRRGRIANR